MKKAYLTLTWQLSALSILFLMSGRLVAQPSVTLPPQDQTVALGDTVTFSVEAEGKQPLMYQWRAYAEDGSFTEIAGATNATLTLSNATYTTTRFAVLITDADGLSILSEPWAQLTVLGPPILTVDLHDSTTVEGEQGELHVTALGPDPMTYDWYFNGDWLGDGLGNKLTIDPVQASQTGSYYVIVANNYGSVTSRTAAMKLVPPTTFTKVTTGPVATDLGVNTGCVWADFDNDGFLDLYVAQFSSGTNLYYHNNGDGTFTRIVQGVYLRNGDQNLGVSVADYDNDGYLDLIVAAGFADPRRAALFHNNRDGTFTQANAGGIANTTGHYSAAEWADYDNDGFVDVLITSLGDSTLSGDKPRLWHNQGDGTFARVTAGPPVSEKGDTWAVLWSDYDNDGLADLLLLNQTSYSTNYLYHNLGQGHFARVLSGPIVTNAISGRTGSEGGDWGDYDNDGLQDLFIADSHGNPNHLYHNNGGGSFSDVNAGAMLDPTDNTHVGVWGDYDNDGYLDLFLSSYGHNTLFRNNQDGTFTEIRVFAPANDTLPDDSFFNSVAWVDYDNDGFLDLFVTAGNGSGDHGNLNFLYHNDGNSNGWLEVKCVGTVANRAGIGAKIRVKATIDGKTFWQMRELSSGHGWDEAKPLVAHFGLGDATHVETLRLEWPSGTVQELSNVPPRRILTITEPPRLTIDPAHEPRELRLRGGRYVTYEIESSSDLLHWSSLGAVTITNLSGTASLVDPRTIVTPQMFYRAVGP